MARHKGKRSLNSKHFLYRPWDSLIKIQKVGGGTNKEKEESLLGKVAFSLSFLPLLQKNIFYDFWSAADEPDTQEKIQDSKQFSGYMDGILNTDWVSKD
ncbi:hypothetical protein CDAR_254711 [Caerostris darwini]|uniref:Uncharacterized protein n=1 Tax=Caerostris darwini TaxID=1538125 RepID=A0AAV4N2V7_9ARAC|nr:hypothetical protein CDAR_254711 [Caerostris darwini]